MSQEHNLFGEMLILLENHELYDLRLRARRKHFNWLADVLGDEIAERELEPANCINETAGREEKSLG